MRDRLEPWRLPLGQPEAPPRAARIASRAFGVRSRWRRRACVGKHLTCPATFVPPTAVSHRFLPVASRTEPPLRARSPSRLELILSNACRIAVALGLRNLIDASDKLGKTCVSRGNSAMGSRQRRFLQVCAPFVH
jgi:hypothetical protein